MSQRTLNTTIPEGENSELTVEVLYIYTPGRIGERHDGARFADPDEPAEVEVIQVTAIEGETRVAMDFEELEPDAQKVITEKCYEAHDGDAQDAAECRAEQRADARRDEGED